MNLTKTSTVLIAISALGALMSIVMMASFSSLYDLILKKVSTLTIEIFNLVIWISISFKKGASDNTISYNITTKQKNSMFRSLALKKYLIKIVST